MLYQLHSSLPTLSLLLWPQFSPPTSLGAPFYSPPGPILDFGKCSEDLSYLLLSPYHSPNEILFPFLPKVPSLCWWPSNLSQAKILPPWCSHCSLTAFVWKSPGDPQPQESRLLTRLPLPRCHSRYRSANSPSFTHVTRAGFWVAILILSSSSDHRYLLSVNMHQKLCWVHLGWNSKWHQRGPHLHAAYSCGHTASRLVWLTLSRRFWPCPLRSNPAAAFLLQEPSVSCLVA